MSLVALKIEAEDWLRYSPLVRGLLARWHLAVGKRLPLGTPREIVRAIDRLCAAARLAAVTPQVLPIEKEIHRRVAQLGGAKFDWTEFEPSADKKQLEKAVVLKPWISEREKGLVYISFEYQWIRLLHNCDLEAFARRYDLVVAPVWACPYSPVNFILPAIYPGRVFCHLSDPHDREILPRLSEKYVVVPLLCSSWVNPDLYQPAPFAQKDNDILMLANFGKYKRHHRLFAALREMPREVRVRLIGQHNGARTGATLKQEARAWGVADQFVLTQNAPEDEVFQALARSKISLILSQREGSCVAVVESLFANTPVGLYAGAEVGSRQFINAKTGRFLQHHNLAAQLLDFLAHAHEYQPRQWALDNQISCYGSSAVLNQAVKETALAAGQEWSQDLAPFHWRPDPQLIHEADRRRMRPSYDEIKQRFGIELGVAGRR